MAVLPESWSGLRAAVASTCRFRPRTRIVAVVSGPPPGAPEPVAPLGETSRERVRRHSRRGRLYAWALLLVGAVVVLVALAVANTRQVELSWVVGSARASVVWIIIGSAILGWLLGMATSIVFRARTRRPRNRPPA
jgi:uncharacterized integral membrane protein